MNYLTFKTCSKGSHNLIQKENMKKNLLLTSIALMSIASAMAEGASTPNKYFTHSAAILQQKQRQVEKFSTPMESLSSASPSWKREHKMEL